MMQERRGYEPPQPLLVRWRQFGDLISIVSGELNRMADDASRLQDFTNDAFLQHFQQVRSHVVHAS